MSVWAVLVAAGQGERLGDERPKAFVRLGRRVLLAESPRAARREPVDRRDRRRRAAGVGGAGDRARRGARSRQGDRVGDGRRHACRVRARRARRGARGRGGDPRPRRGAAARHGRGDRACAAAALGGLRRRGSGPARRRHRQAGPRRRPSSRRSTVPSSRGPDAAGVPGGCVAQRGGGRGHRLRLARRGARRPDPGRRGRPAAAQGHDAGRSRARGVVAVRRPSRRHRRRRARARGGRSARARRRPPRPPDRPRRPLRRRRDRPRADRRRPRGRQPRRHRLALPLGRGALSRGLLARTARPGVRGRARGRLELVNADCVLVGERPRIGPHRAEMAAKLAAALGVEADRVAVRATTTDHLGFTGREEGLAAQAVALLQRER